MRFGTLFLAIIAVVSFAQPASSQQMPPIEPPKPSSASQYGTTTLHVVTNEVLVPTLVEKKGSILYGLKPEDFVLEDNGVPQKIHVQEEMDTSPVALVVAVEQGGASVLQFDKFSRLGPLLDMFLSDHRSQVALVGFDSQPGLIQDFTHSSEKISNSLKHLEPGDGGAAILDSTNYAVDLLEMQPKEYRRVLLLICEQRDHGSKFTKPAQLIKKIGQSDVLILSVAFSPAVARVINDVTTDAATYRGTDFITPLLMAIQAFRKNVTKEIAHMSGGEYTTFIGDKGFEARVLAAAKDARNRYLITFSPTDATPGLHTIRVRTKEDYGARIVARANYWRDSPDSTPTQ